MNGMMVSSFSGKHVMVAFLSIFFIGLGIRFFYFPYELPLVIDARDNFTYATAINYYGHLPSEWSPPNNGWPIFLSFWFSIINLDNTFQYMQLQRTISVILSSLIVIPVYFLCKKFFDEKLALVGMALFIFDPRIIINSLLGITEPLYILLGVLSLIIFLRYERKAIIVSFILASFCTIVRSEGIFLFFTLTILFFLRYKLSKEILKTYLPSVIVFLIILSPIINYRIEVIGYDGIFQRASGETVRILANSSQGGPNEIIAGLELFIKYLGWIMIPTFVVFVPFGIIQFLRTRTNETNFIIVFLLVSTPPILYAGIAQAHDTRYFYFLYPIFCLVSLFAVKSYLTKLSNKNLLLAIIIIGILLSSIGFYEYKKIDYTKEKELNEIAKIVAKRTTGLNFHPAVARYISVAELPNEWPFIFNDSMQKIKMSPTGDYETLEDYITNSREHITHILVDDNPNLDQFLQDLYHNETQYDYLIKVFDSTDMDFQHQVKLFKIDFEKFDSMNRTNVRSEPVK